MAYLLTLSSESEAGDIIEWLHAHRDEEDWPRGTTATRDWLRGVMWEAGVYPVFAAVPAEHVEVLTHAIEDWSEVLSAHDESLLSALTEQV